MKSSEQHSTQPCQVQKVGKSRYEAARKWLLFWCLFIGIGAVAGSVGMLLHPDGSAMGMDAMLPYFQVLPFADILFQNFIFSGIALLIVNGLSNLMAAFLILRRRPLGVTLGGCFGITLMLWICIQFYIFPLNFMSTIYFVFGFLQAVTGFMTWVFCRQEAFARQERLQEEQVQEEQVQEEQNTEKHLVVYFSRLGAARHYARELAQSTGADLYEIKATEHTAGTAGFWWCGRYGMHRWEMPIEPVNIALEQYERVTICSPIWVFQLSAPVRSFCRQSAGKIKTADYILVHFQKFRYQNACEEMDELLKVKRQSARSICFRWGREVRRYEC